MDNLPRWNDLRIERNYQSGIPAAKPHFDQVQADPLGNHKIFGSMPTRSQLF